jgi:glycosyltransferase involved in cell wall biosynthesis
METALGTASRHARRPRVLLLSMYALDEVASGPTVRITHLRDELGKAPMTSRARDDLEIDELAELRAVASRRAGRLDGVYVESSSFLPAESDLAFLGLLRATGVPIVAYVRDAYQLFPEYYAVDSLRRWVSRRAFLPAVRALAAVSSSVAVPTDGLGRAILGPSGRWVLLPPGAPAPVDVPLADGANQLLFVGDARWDAQGGGRLVEAVSAARATGVDVGLTIVARPGQEPAGTPPDWLRVVRASGGEIHALLPSVVATVVPRPRTAYNDLALPIKLFDYLSYGRPILATPCLEQADLVVRTRAGLVVPEEPGAMGSAFAAFLARPVGERQAMGRRAHEAARNASWGHRARRILELLGLGASISSSGGGAATGGSRPAKA